MNIPIDQKEELFRQLKRLPIFWRIEEAGIRHLLSLMHHLNFNSGEVIFEENEPGDALYIIVEGKVDIFRKFPPAPGLPPTAVSLAVLSEKMIFGEMTILAPGKRTAGARAMEKTTLLKLEKQDFKDNLEKGEMACFKLSYNIGCIVCERLRLMDSRLINLMQENQLLKQNSGILQSLA